MSFIDDAVKGIGGVVASPKAAETLSKLGETVAQNPKGAFAELGTAYCVSQRSDLYYGAMGIGAGLGVVATLVLVLVVRALRGKAA